MNITDQLAQALEEATAALANTHGLIQAHYIGNQWDDDARDQRSAAISRATEALRAYRASKEGEKWRMLEQGETIQEGDQYIPFHRNGWEPVKDGSTGLPLSSFNVGYYRRPIRAT